MGDDVDPNMKFSRKSQPSSADAVAPFESSQDDGKPDGSGFLNPESSLPSNREFATSDWSKERSFQQLELSDVHQHSQTGCCRRIMECLVAKALHTVDIVIGFASLVYGSLLCTQFEATAKAAVLFCLVLGTIHLVTSSLGILSLCARGCSRFGLQASAAAGPYFTLVYATIFISLIYDQDGFVKYLEDHEELMYLGTDIAENVEKLMPLIYTTLTVLGLLEASRFHILLKMQDRLLRLEAERSLIPQSDSYTVRSNTLTEALLEGNTPGQGGEETGESGGSRARETTGTPNWWQKNEI